MMIKESSLVTVICLLSFFKCLLSGHAFEDSLMGHILLNLGHECPWDTRRVNYNLCSLWATRSLWLWMPFHSYICSNVKHTFSPGSHSKPRTPSARQILLSHVGQTESREHRLPLNSLSNGRRKSICFLTNEHGSSEARPTQKPKVALKMKFS